MRGHSLLAVLGAAVASGGCTSCPCEGGAEAGPAPLYADVDTPFLPADVAGVARPRRWTVLVVHHAASAVGGATRFDAWHKARGWDGVGYDFVIGNGTDTGDGAIETTFRWREQRDGAHVKGWNDVAVGVCLVGNLEETAPTPAQWDALVHLVRHLRRRFSIPPERVVGHRALGTTQCPGKNLDLAALRTQTDPSGTPP